MRTEQEWVSVNVLPPPHDVIVETKIEGEKGCRNVQKLRRRGSLYYFPDNFMYVYYRPTHWRHCI